MKKEKKNGKKKEQRFWERPVKKGDVEGGKS